MHNLSGDNIVVSDCGIDGWLSAFNHIYPDFIYGIVAYGKTEVPRCEIVIHGHIPVAVCIKIFT